MGCWNGTCGLSQLPIMAGERVVVYLLEHEVRRGTIADGICYATDICEPIFLPFYGEYNDYGGVENVDKDFNTEMIIKWANAMLAVGRKEKPTGASAFLFDGGLYLDEAEIKEKEERVTALQAAGQKVEPYERRLRHDPIKKFASIEEFFTAIERGRVTFGSPKSSAGRPYMTYMMVREDVHKAIVKATIQNIDEYRQRAKEWSPEEATLKYQKHLEKDTQLLLEWLHDAANSLDPSYFPGLTNKPYISMWGEGKVKAAMGRLNYMVSALSGSNGFAMRELSQLLISLIKADQIEKNGKDWKLLKKRIVEYSVFSKAMAKLRKIWMPQAGAGSQDTEFKLHSELATIVQKVAKKEKQYA